jgi:hypothetical protein
MKNKQKMEGMRLKGDATQTSDLASTDMKMNNVAATNATQRIEGKEQSIEVFGWRGRGLWAVVGLVAVALAWIVAKVLIK